MNITECKVGQIVARAGYKHGNLEVGDTREIIEIHDNYRVILKDDVPNYKHDPSHLRLVADIESVNKEVTEHYQIY